MPPAIGGWLNKNSQWCYFAWENLEWGFCDVGCCYSLFIVVLHSLMFLHLRGPWRSPPALSSTLATFDCFCFSIYRERYGFEWAFFTHRRFLPYTPSPIFLTQPAFIKTSLGAGSSFLEFAGLHADPCNTDPDHLFVWFTAIHNLDIQKNSFLNRAKYYHELLVIKSLV